MYTRESFDQLRERINIVEVISEHIPLKKKGATYKASCPFHSENTPSFIVYGSQGYYHCFGCGAHGDAISFLMNYLSYSFSESVLFLANKFEINLVTENSGEKTDGSKAQLRTVCQEAGNVFRYCLFNLSAARDAVKYLYNRGFTVDTFHKFGIGFAPEKAVFLRMMNERGIHSSRLQEAGFCLEGKASFLFEDRITFPIFDFLDRIVGFSARKYRDSVYGGKYVNTPETAVFKKSSLLYGLNLCRRRIAKEKRVIIVEGQIDCLQLIDAGLNLTVAALGTAFGESHVNELGKLGVKKVFLLFDGDEAGRKAALKVGDLFQIYGIDVYVCLLSEKCDPDSFVRKEGVDALIKILDSAQDYLSFLIFSIAAEKNLRSPVEKADLIDVLSKQIHNWKNPVIIHESLKKLASIMQLPEEAVEFGRPLYLRPVNWVKSLSAKQNKLMIDPNKILETDVLRWLIRFGGNHPYLIATAAHFLTENHFYLTDCRVLFRFCLSLDDTQEFLSPIKIHELVEDSSLVDIIFRRRINGNKLEEGFLESLQKLLEREWLEAKDKIQIKINNSSDKEIWVLLREFEALQKSRPRAYLVN